MEGELERSDGTRLARSAAVQRVGLIALAETYGLERAELQELKLLGQRFFDGLAEILARYLGAPIEIAELTQRSLSFADFCSAAPNQHTVLLGFEDEPVMMFRIENNLALAMVNLLFGANAAGGSLDHGDGVPALTATEAHIVSNVLEKSLVRAFEPVSSGLFGKRRSIQVLHGINRVRELANAPDPAEAAIAIEARCSLNEQPGWLGIALPTSMIFQIRRRLVPAPATPPEPRSPVSLVSRTALAEASVTLRAILNTQTLPLSNIRQLTAGSIVPLGKLWRNLPQVELTVEGQTLVHGTIVEERGWRRFLIQHCEVQEGRGHGNDQR